MNKTLNRLMNLDVKMLLHRMRGTELTPYEAAVLLLSYGNRLTPDQRQYIGSRIRRKDDYNA